jgi:hypothetical protein
MVRWAESILVAGLIAVSACHGATITEGDAGSPGQGGGSGAGAAGRGGASGTAGTGGGASGTTGTGGATAGTAGRGGSSSGNGGSAGANACSRCETPCRDGVCDLALVRSTTTSVVNSSATSVALNDGRLYFVVGPGVQVLSVPAGGGPEAELYPHHDCSNCQLSLAVDGADVFFAGQNVAGANEILAVPKSGGDGTARVVCPTPSAFPIALTLEGDYVYYARADTGIERCPKAGGATMHVATAGSPQSPNVVIRTSSRPGAVLWGDRDTGVVTRVDTSMPSLPTSKVVGIMLNPEQTYPGGVCDVVDDGTQAYWVLCGWPYNVYVESGVVNSPTMRAVALGGGDPNAAFDQYGSIGLDSGYIYFTEAGFLDRVPKGGGTVEARARLADGQGNVLKALIVGFDDRYVYLARAITGDAAIYRVVK